MAGRRFFEFGRFRLDPTGRLLFRGDQAIPLPPKAADVLLLLLQRPGNVVDKEDLLKEVWQDTCVEEGSLARTVSILRKALDEGDEGQEYIVTLPKRGYRFAVPVTVVEDSEALPTLPRTAATPSLQPVAMSSTRVARNAKVIALAVATLAVVLFAVLGVVRYLGRPTGLTGRRTIAVLPFQNLTGDRSQEYVADGLTEEMITQLGGLNDAQLAVIARTSAMIYKGTTKPVDQIGRELGANYVLEGSVRRWGDRVRISAQLIQTSDQTHLWAKNYDSDAADILRLQSAVAQAVAEEISLTLTPETKARFTSVARVDPRVHELCLRGRYEWNKRTAAGLYQAVSYFQQAIGRDPSYAPAYAGLADAYAILPYYSDAPPSDNFAKARAAADKALQLDESLAEAHATLGLVEAADGDFRSAERQYSRALQLNPNYATAHHWHSFTLWVTRHEQEAIAELERARQLDPLSLIIYTDEGRTLAAAHQTVRAIALLKAATELDPNFAEAHRALGAVYMQSGQAEQAIAEARRGVELDPNDYEQSTLAFVYAMGGKTGEARGILGQLTRPGRRPPVSPFYVALIYTGLRDNKKAIEYLEQAYREHSLLGAVGPEAMLDSLRSEPQFKQLMERTQADGEANSVMPKS